MNRGSTRKPDDAGLADKDWAVMNWLVELEGHCLLSEQEFEYLDLSFWRGSSIRTEASCHMWDGIYSSHVVNPKSLNLRTEK